MSRATAPLLSRLGYQYCSAQMLRRPLVGAQAFRSPLASSVLVRGMAVASHRMPLHKPAPVRDEFLRSLTTEELENMDIGIKEHRKPEDLSDKIAFRTVKALRVIADAFFREKYIHRAVTLETVAAVPGMVAGLHRHLRSLRRMDHDGGWINHLLAEAENERMHLLTWMKVSQPTLLERAIVLAVQGSFFNFYFLLYLFAPKTAHRVVGYLEEEAIISYTQMIAEIDAGRIPNGPAPTIAINYWNLPETARIREVTLAVRADEAMHRDTNHEFADRIKAHRENLRQEALNNQEQTNSGSKSTNS